MTEKRQNMVKKLLGDRRGSIAIIFAGSVLVLLGFASLAIDASNLYLNKVRDQRAADIIAIGTAAQLAAHGTTSTYTAQANAVSASLMTLNAGNTGGAAGTPTYPTTPSFPTTASGTDSAAGTVNTSATVTVGVASTQNLFLAQFVRYTAQNIPISGGSTATFTGAVTTTITSSGGSTGNNCATVGGGGIRATNGGSFSTSNSSGGCGLVSQGTISTDNSGSTIALNGGSVTTNATAKVVDNNGNQVWASSCYIGSGSCTSGNGGGVGSGVVQNSTTPITDPVLSDATSKGYWDALDNISGQTFTVPSCTTTFDAMAFSGNVPSSGTTYSDKGFQIYQGKVNNQPNYVLPGPPSGSTYCFSISMGGNGEYVTFTGGSGNIVINGYSPSGSTNHVAFGSSTYYFPHGLSLSSSNDIVTFAAGNYYVTGQLLLVSTITMSDLENWTINNSGGTAIESNNANNTINWPCQTAGQGPCNIDVNGNVDFTSSPKHIFGNEIFLINGTLSFTNSSPYTSASGTGVSFFAEGTISVNNGANLTLNANPQTSTTGSTGVLFGTKSNSSSAAILLGGGTNTKLSGVLYAPNGTIDITNGASANTSGVSNACLEFVANQIIVGGGSTASTTCSGFGGGTASSGTPPVTTSAGNSSSGSGTGSNAGKTVTTTSKTTTLYISK